MINSTPLSNSLSFPTLTLGTMTFGGQTDEKNSIDIMNFAFENGMSFFDTANIYNGGNSEIIVGRWIKNKREKITLASKVGYPMGGGLAGVCLNRKAMNSEFEASLKRLDTDYLDLYYMHAPDYTTPIEESLEVMTGFIESGKVHHFGVSNFAAWQLADLLAACDQHGFIKPIITQNVYNAVTRGIESELIPFLNKHPMALTVYNPIAAGLLTRKHQSGIPAEGSRLKENEIYHNRYWTKANLSSSQKLASLAKENNIDILELALKFCLANPKVTTILTGVSKVSQLEQNIKSIKGERLSDELIKACDLVWQEHTGNPFNYNR